jgi:hypothetical protein
MSCQCEDTERLRTEIKQGAQLYVAHRRHVERTVPQIVDLLSRLSAGWDPADFVTLTKVRDLLDSLTNIVKWFP